MAEICLDNSTDCLLRAILDRNDPSFILNVANVVTTAAIGFLALVVALTTVFQGLLAAGPGRMKANSTAIGIFSKSTTSRISWRHFAWRSTAYVPIITLVTLENSLAKLEVNEDYDASRRSPIQRGEDIGIGASWLLLLRSVCIEDTSFFDCTPCAIDFLPPDIPVPLASIDLATLAILAALFDNTVRIEKSQNLCTIRGSVSQVSFREHPVLGTLAAYERYDFRSSRPKAFLPSGCTFSSLSTAHGIIGITWEKKTYTLIGSRLVPGPVLRDSLPLLHSEYRSKGVKLYDFWQIVKEHHDIKRTYCTESKNMPPYNLKSKAVIRNDWGIAVAFIVAQTEYELRPFPWRLMDLRCGVIELANQAPVLSKGFQATLNLLHRHICPENSNSEQDFPPATAQFKRRGTWVIPIDSTTIPRYSDNRHCEQAVHCCLHFLSDLGHPVDGQDWIWSSKDSPWIPELLQYVDSFLSDVDKNNQSALKTFTSVVNRIEDGSNVGQTNQPTAPTARRTSAFSSTSHSSNPGVDPTAIPIPASPTQTLSTNSGSSYDNEVGTLEANLTAIDTNKSAEPRLSATISTAEGSQQRRYRPSSPRSTSMNWLQEPTATEVLETMLAMRGILFAACLRYGVDTSALFEGDPVWPMLKML